MAMTIGLAGLALGAASPARTGGSDAPRPADRANRAAGVDRSVLHVQVILDKLGYAPGLLDGRRGQSLTGALKAFQTVRGLRPTGEMDRPTLQALNRYAAIRPTRRLRLSAESLAGPYVNPFPTRPEAQARLDRLGYRSPLEKLAEMFHTSPETLVALNSAATRLVPGAELTFPNALPGSRAYPADLPDTWRRTLNDLNVDARQPRGTKVVVDKSDAVLRVYDAADRLVAQFPATMGSSHDPLPIGRWRILGKAYNPPFHYNPRLFWDVSDSRPAVRLPPGPNGPVGVIWIDLSKPHYGIHGTSEPQTIGRAESHGCIRLSNWDAARLSLMIEAGTPAIFQE